MRVAASPSAVPVVDPTSTPSSNRARRRRPDGPKETGFR